MQDQIVTRMGKVAAADHHEFTLSVQMNPQGGSPVRFALPCSLISLTKNRKVKYTIDRLTSDSHSNTMNKCLVFKEEDRREASTLGLILTE